MADLKLKADTRKVFGRKVSRLRKDGLIPATVYGKNVKSQSLNLEEKVLQEVYKKAGETGVIDLTVNSEKQSRPVLIHNVQLHPVTDQVLHVEFHQVDLTKKVTVNIPVETIGKAPAVEKGGVLISLMDELEVEALPTDLPEKFVVDISKLEEVGDSILLKDLDYDKAKVELRVEDMDAPLVKIDEPKEEEEEPEPEAAGAAEGEAATGESLVKEGEKPAEGDKTDETKPSKSEGKSEDKKEEKSAEDKK